MICIILNLLKLSLLTHNSSRAIVIQAMSEETLPIYIFDCAVKCT